MMRAVKVLEKGPPECLRVSQIALPKLDPNSTSPYLLLRVGATAINRADTLERKGLYPVPKVTYDMPEGVLGVEAAGEVYDMTPNAKKWEKGERVMALVTGGGYAEYCIVHQDHVMKIPKNLSVTQAAAIPEVWLTAYQLLHFEGKVKKGDFVLVHGGGSGVGTALTQLIHSFGAKSIITAGSQDKIDKCKELHADFGINYKTEDFVEKVKEFTNGHGADVILDPIGGQYFEKNLETLAIDGRWVLYGTMGGGDASGPLLSKLLRKRGKLIATTLRNRSDAYKAELVGQFAQHAIPLFEQGVYLPIIDTVLPLEKAAEAHTRMEANANTGKIVLEVSSL